MKVSLALKIFKDYQKANLRPSTIAGYRYLMDLFEEFFGGKDVSSLSSEDVYHFLEMITESNSKATKGHRYAQLKAFLNFIIMNYELDVSNPLDTPLMRKTFRKPKTEPRKTIPREIIDELVFKCKDLRDRLILELQAKCGARIGEVLKIRVKDIDGRRINRLKTYIQQKGLTDDDRVFNLCYTAARSLIKGIGKKVGVKLNPHDLRRHSATFASRNGVPIEIISKVLLRHQNLKTTQLYLGKVTDSEAQRPSAGWISYMVSNSIGNRHFLGPFRHTIASEAVEKVSEECPLLSCITSRIFNH
jgi:integrase